MGTRIRSQPVRQHKGLTWKDWREEDGAAGSQVGPYLSQGAPSSLQHDPGLQATLVALGVQPGPQGAMSARQCKLLGIVWGRDGGGEGGGNLAGGQAAVSTCLLPAPLPQNRFGQSGVQEGGWNNGSPMPRRGSEGPQTYVLKTGRHCFSSQETSHPSSRASQV